MILGIDLGTTYSVCSFLDENGEPQIVINTEGSRITPSVVYFESESSVIVGQAAKDNSITFPSDVISAVKNDMGIKKTYPVSYVEKCTPEVVSSFILKKIVSDANKYLDPEKPINDVIITIPAYFTDAQRVATEDAARIAGLNLIKTINEPTAAALYYATKSKLDHANILIYDLGGGTFDVTIVRIDGNDINVKSTSGISKVGGRFFDEEIVDHIQSYIEDKYDIDLEDEEYLDIYQELFSKAEKAKIQLSSQNKAVISVRGGSFKESITITREFFENIVSKLYRRTEFNVNKALKDAGLTAADLDKVILVGGSSRIPYIENHLEALLGIKPSHEVNPDEVVAMGAAIYGRQLSDNGASDGKVIHDVCSHSIGVVTIDPSSMTKINSIIIKRNSPVPTDALIPFRTASDNQKEIDISITEGEFREVSDVTIIANEKIRLPEQLAMGTRGNIRLQLDKSQLVHAFLNIPEINYEKEFTFTRSSNLTQQEVDRLTGIIADYEIG